MKIWDPVHGREEDAEEVSPATVKLRRGNIEELVEDWAEEDDNNSAEFTLHRTVHVRDDDGVLHAFRVEGEVVPQYAAYEQESE